MACPSGFPKIASSSLQAFPADISAFLEVAVWPPRSYRWGSGHCRDTVRCSSNRFAKVLTCRSGRCIVDIVAPLSPRIGKSADMMMKSWLPRQQSLPACMVTYDGARWRWRFRRHIHRVDEQGHYCCGIAPDARLRCWASTPDHGRSTCCR